MKKIETELDNLKRTGARQLSLDVIKELSKMTVVVPGVMPKDTNPEILKKLMQNSGKNQPLPEGVAPRPCIFQNEKKENLLPVFTSEKEMKRSPKAPEFPLLLNMTFQSCIHFVENNPEVSGIVLNAYTHNVIFHPNKKPKQPKEQKTKISLQQYHFLLRQRLESAILPEKLFTRKEEFVTALCKEKGSCIMQLYDALYDAEIACPYTAEDFSLLSLNITDSLLLCQVTMPQKNLSVNMCPNIFFAWDSSRQKIWYYAIVLSGKEQKPRLFEVYENGKNADLGEAPAEGSELSAVLDRIQGAEKEN